MEFQKEGIFTLLWNQHKIILKKKNSKGVNVYFQILGNGQDLQYFHNPTENILKREECTWPHEKEYSKMIQIPSLIDQRSNIESG